MLLAYTKVELLELTVRNLGNLKSYSDLDLDPTMLNINSSELFSYTTCIPISCS